MIHILYNPDGTIKTYMEDLSDLQLAPGETFTASPLSMEEYAARFTISYKGQTCFSVTTQVGDADVEIDVNAPGRASIFVDVNGSEQVVELTNGKGSLTISTVSPGVFTLTPTDKRSFCAAGNGSISVEVV